MSLVDAWERFATLGEKVGLAGSELRKWVVDQVKAAEDKQKGDLEREARRLEREANQAEIAAKAKDCLLYTSPSPRDRTRSRMPSSA